MQSDSEVLDLNGRVKEMKESVEYRGSKEGSTTTVETVYRFTSYGALTEFIVHSGGQIQGRLVYTHNSDGSRSEKLLYSKDEGPTFRREVKTDGEGRKLQVAQYCGGGFLMYTEKYRYQPGDVVEVSKYNHDGHLTEVRHLKYADGRLSETTGPYDYMEVRTYYDGGQPKEVNVYGTKHQLASETTYAYKFDKYGNWIERHTRRRYREAGQQVEKESLDYRTITYYSTEGREADKGETTGERAAPDSGPEAEKSVPAIVRKSGGVLQGAALKRVELTYPSIARSNHITGEVVVEVTIDECGRVVSSHPLTGPAELREASADAARKWLFDQTRLNKIPVKVIGTVTFHFAM